MHCTKLNILIEIGVGYTIKKTNKALSALMIVYTDLRPDYGFEFHFESLLHIIL